MDRSKPADLFTVDPAGWIFGPNPSIYIDALPGFDLFASLRF